MTPVDPGPYVLGYMVVVFGAPWLVFMSFNVRKLFYARRTGIGLRSSDATAQIRMLRQSDSHAAYLHERCRRWFKITGIMWLLGVLLLGAGLYLFHNLGVIQ